MSFARTKMLSKSRHKYIAQETFRCLGAAVRRSPQPCAAPGPRRRACALVLTPERAVRALLARGLDLPMLRALVLLRLPGVVFSPYLHTAS